MAFPALPALFLSASFARDFHMSSTPSPQKEAGYGLDLLRYQCVRGMVRAAWFPYIFQTVFLLVFVALAIVGWGRYAPEGVADKLYAKVNIVNLLIWGLWWPAMVWLAVGFGRVWCAVCPLELVANGTERLGRKIGLGQMVLSRRLRSGVVILIVYGLVQLLVAGVHLHRVPAYTSWFLLAMLTMAAIVGLLAKDRAFCRGFCPVGLLLATYGRGAMLAVRRVSQEVCDGCSTKGCTFAAGRELLDGRSCPSLLNPARLSNNADCLVCGQCIKACEPANMGLFLRRPFHGSDVRQELASWPLTLFVILVSGFVGYELCSEWAAAKTVFNWVPATIGKALGEPALEGWIKGVWMLGALPAIVWSLLGGLVVLLRGAATLGEALRRLALPLAVIISAGHMAKGLAKVASWGGYLPFALRDPAGVETALRMSDGRLSTPSPIISMTVVWPVSALLVTVMILFAIRESRLADPTTHSTRVPAILAAGLASLFLVIGWCLPF